MGAPAYQRLIVSQEAASHIVQRAFGELRSVFLSRGVVLEIISVAGDEFIV